MLNHALKDSAQPGALTMRNDDDVRVPWLFEQMYRTTLAQSDRPHEKSSCDRHRYSGLNVSQHPILLETSLLPVCDECCQSVTGVRPDEAVPPFDNCRCATSILQASRKDCWLCELEAMAEKKHHALSGRTRTIKATGRQVVLCKCGKEVKYQLEGAGEPARQCACCDGIVTFPFTNCQKDTLVWERGTANIQTIYSARSPPPFSAEMLTATSRAQFEAETRLLAAAASGPMLSAPTGSVPAAQPQMTDLSKRKRKGSVLYKSGTVQNEDYQDGRDSKRHKVAASANMSLPKSIRPLKDMPRTRQRRVGSASQTRAPAVVSSEAQRDPGTVYNHLQDATNPASRNSASPQAGVKASPTSKPFETFSSVKLDPHVILDYAREAMKPDSPAYASFRDWNEGRPQPASYLAHPARNIHPCDLKIVLREQYQNAILVAVPGSPLNRVFNLEKENKAKAMRKVFRKDGYDNELAKCGFDEGNRQRIGAFVERVWNNKVAANEVGIVAGIALSYSL